MSNTIQASQVGAQDEELKNSPISEEADDEREVLKQEVPGELVCYFNNQSFSNGNYVCSGNALLRCDYGIRARVGSCDPENP